MTVIVNLGLAALNLYQRRQIEQQQRQGGYEASPKALKFEWACANRVGWKRTIPAQAFGDKELR